MLILRRLAALARALFIAAVIALPALAAAVDTAPPAALDQLVKLLADPELRSWLDHQVAAQAGAAAPAVAATAPTLDRSGLSAALQSVKDYVQAMVAAAPRLPQEVMGARSLLMADVEEWHFGTIFGLVGAFVFVGLVLDWLAHRATLGFRRWMAAQSSLSPHSRARALIGRLVYAAIMLAAFFIGSIGLFLAFDWPPLLRELVLDYLVAAILIRSVLMVGRATLLPPMLKAPDAAAMRLFPISDAAARHWYRWSAILVGLFAVSGATFAVLARLGFDPDAQHLLMIPASLLCLAGGLVALWRRPAVAGQTRFGRSLASWLVTLYFLVLNVIAISGLTVLFAFAVTVVALPALILLWRNGVHHVLRPSEGEGPVERVPPVTIALIDRGIRIVLIVIAAWFLLRATGTTMTMMGTMDAWQTRMLRAGINALIIVLAADFGWTLIKAFVEHRLHAPPHGGTEDQAAEHARLRTLLPIIQNIIFAALVVLTVLMVLSSFGIDIAPLIAGAGVLGVAIGFGAQTVVKDVISGIFYMLDDAFRIGEYIQTGSYKGTVESFSIRSIRLRHHRGPIYTVPFGELGAVQNMSRDWSKDKFLISVTYDTDLEQVRKIAKRVGTELLADPEFGPFFIEPLKMKGVEQFGEYGISIGFGMMVKPGGQQAMIRRRAYAMIRAAFAAAGIDFASPTVHVAGGDPNAAAALATKIATDRKTAEAAAAAAE